MDKQLEFYDTKTKRKFRSSDYKFEKRATAKGTATTLSPMRPSRATG